MENSSFHENFTGNWNLENWNFDSKLIPMAFGIWKFDSSTLKTTGIKLEYMFPDSRFQ
jgi:hypothetical protein